MEAEQLPVIPIDVDAKKEEEPLDFAIEENVQQFIRPSRWISLDIAGFRIFRFNWVVTLMASVVLWGFVIYVSSQDAAKNDEGNNGNNPAFVTFGKWQTWVTQNFTWLYIGTQDFWMVFVIWIACSKYGSMKLGKEDEKPEYNDFSWFAMLFTCGIAVGLYFYGVAEPVYYYRTPWNNPLMKPGFHYKNDDQRAQQAMTITLYHWGFHAWACYILAALTIGFVAYRWNMPMTIRTAFYPLVGDVANGLLGDLIDALSMACTTFGVCTSLGLGVQNILMGMHRLDCSRGYNCAWTTVPPSDTSEKSRDWSINIIWIITLIATISVVTGLKTGIYYMSQIAFLMGSFTLVALTFLDNTWFILGSYVQSIGHYFQYVIQIGFECDTWQQLMHEWKFTEYSASGNLLWDSGRNMVWNTVTQSGVTSTLPNPSCTTQNMDNTIVSAVINTTSGAFSNVVTAGTLQTSTTCGLSDYFGESSSNTMFMDYWTIFYWGWWISWVPFVGMFIAKISRGRTIREVVIGGMLAPIIYSFFYLVVLGSLGIKMQRVVETALGVTANIETGRIDCAALGYAGGEPVSAQAIALADAGYYALPCRPLAMRYYDVLQPYGRGIADFLTVCSLIGIVLYFVTSSDSGSYIDDTLSAGGLDSPPPLQRVYWAFTEGAIAITLMYYGGSQTMKALRSISIISGLPYTLAMMFMCTALLRAVKLESKEEEITKATRFNTGLFDFTEGFAPKARSRYDPTLGDRTVSLLISVVAPWYEMFKVHSVLYDWPTAVFWTVAIAACQFAWIFCLILEVSVANASALGWAFYFFMICFIAIARQNARTKHNVYGFVLEDVFASLVMYPFVVSQMSLHVTLTPLPGNVAEKELFELPSMTEGKAEQSRTCC